MLSSSMRVRGRGLRAEALALLLSLLLFVPAQSQEEAQAGDRILTTQTMDAVMAQYNETGLLVEFFLPWCGHSRRLRPELRKAAEVMGGKPYFARVDCSTVGGQPLCQQHEILYHPSILYYSKGLSFEFQKRATAQELIKYCKRMASDNVKEFDSMAQLVKSLEEEQVIVVAFVNERGEYEDFFEQGAGNLKDQLIFGSVSKPEILEAFGIKKTPSYVIIRHGQPSLLWNQQEQEKQVDQAKNEEMKVSKGMQFTIWVAEQATRLVEALTQENYLSKLGAGVPALILFADDSAGSAAAVKSIYKAATEFKGRINFCTVNGARYQTLAVKLGVTPHLLPAVAIVDIKNQSQFVMPSTTAITEESVVELCSNFMHGKLKPTLRSAKEPEYEEGPVYTVVADSFNRRVMDPSKDVVVNFRTTWCGFCNLFGPIFHALAASAADVETLTFFEFDVTHNDPEPHLNITSFPSLVLFPAKNKTAIHYTGERNIASLTKFLEEHVSVKPEVGPEGNLISKREANRIKAIVDSVKSSLLTGEQL